jgi:hypothetical protein
MLVDDPGRGVLTRATAAADRQGALYVEERARAAVDGLPNLAVRHCMTNANVHPGPQGFLRWGKDKRK